MTKRKPKAAKRTCPHCGSEADPVKATLRAGTRCRACPDCRGQIK